MIGLALSGGSVKGAYEAGSARAFKKMHIKIDGYVGTSIGSFNAAMLASNRSKELLKFWQNVDVKKALNLDEKFTKAIENKEIKGTVLGIKQIVTNKGVSILGLKEILESLNIEESIRKSSIDFGLVTVRVKPLKVLHLFKEDIPQGKIADYLMGSCYHPIFKLEKIIDEKYYLDGGFYDVMPVNMLLDRNYDKVYAIDLKSIGVRQKIKDKSKVTIIKPSHSLGSEFTFNKEQINKNIKLGYYDTLKVLKKLDGKKFIFKKIKNYDKMLKNISLRRKKEMMLHFKVLDNKDLIIKIVEYFMTLEKYNYLEVYNLKRVIKKLRKTKFKRSNYFNFLKDLNV